MRDMADFGAYQGQISRAHNRSGVQWNPASATSYEEVIKEICALQAQQRPIIAKSATVVSGALMVLLGMAVALAMLTAEPGFPLLLAGLRLLALQFNWAANGYARLGIWYLKQRAWFRTNPPWVLGLIIAGAVALVLTTLF